MTNIPWVERHGRAVSYFKAAIKPVGVALTLAAVCFVIWSFYWNGLFVAAIWLDARLWWRIIIAAVGYCACMVLLGAPWVILINSVTDRPIEWRDGLAVFSISQLYKYLPSNMLHYVSRHFMLRKRGVEHLASGWGAVAEAALILTAALTISATFGMAVLRQMMTEDVISRILVLGGVSVLVAVCALVFVFARYRTFARRFISVRMLKAYAMAALLYLFFFLFTGMLFWYVAGIAPERANLGVGTSIALWAGAWSVGFVTPGASSGIGIRDALIIVGLNTVGMSDDAVLVAVAFRISTTIGDVLLGALGACLRKRH